jgi:hypothetical protein
VRTRVAAGLTAFLALSLLAVPTGVASTPVGLGTAGAFAVLAGSGITNTGATTITGDVGTYPTPAQTGFGSVTLVPPSTNHGSDAVAQGAKSDARASYADAAGRPADLVATELGGTTLAGGVYRADSGTFQITGTLKLDGEGDPDTVFVLQATSTLVTASGSNVQLLRGALACNVFWTVGSAATLGSGSVFTGTILAHDDISLDDAVTVHGRLLAGLQGSGAGAVTLIHDTVDVSPCHAKPSSSSSSSSNPPSTTPGPSSTSGSSSPSPPSGTASSSSSTSAPGNGTGVSVPLFPTVGDLAIAVVAGLGGVLFILRRRLR